MTNPEDQFEDLQKLLHCKRYEQPPPRFFHTFADHVLDQLETDEEIQYSSWWSWLVARFDARPVLVCAYGLAVTSLLLLGFRISQAFESESFGAPAPASPWLAFTPGSPVLLSQQFIDSANSDSFATPSGFTFPSREDGAKLFPPRTSLMAQPAAFHFAP